MKANKILKISMIVILLVTVLATVVAPVFAATDPKTFTPTDPGDSGNGIVNKILGFAQWIGSALAVIMLVVIGIKYMVGSAEEKAEYKKTLMPYVIGAILIFAASNIASWVYSAFSGM